jgi:hypothetical protein
LAFVVVGLWQFSVASAHSAYNVSRVVPCRACCESHRKEEPWPKGLAQS